MAARRSRPNKNTESRSVPNTGQTGIRDGETVYGPSWSNQTAGAKMKIRGQFPPLTDFVVNLPDQLIRDYFNNYPFFKDMSFKDRKAWLIKHQNPNGNMYLQDAKIDVKFEAVSKHIEEKLGPDQTALLVRGNPNDPEGYWPIKEVVAMFPAKPGSKGIGGGRHTLVFRPGIWCLVEDNGPSLADYRGLKVIIETGKVSKGRYRTGNYGIIIQKEPEFLVMSSIPFVDHPDKKEFLMTVLREFVSPDTISEIETQMGWFTPSVHKSLIQKIIRSRCAQVKFLDGIRRSSLDVLRVSFVLLMAAPGTFDPDFQRYTTGFESATKRLAVSILEDGFTLDHETMTTLLSAAIVAQNDKLKSWYPDADLMRRWLAFVEGVMQNPQMYKYDAHQHLDSDELDDISPGDNLKLNYHLLDRIGSFKTDIVMTGSIGLNGGKPRKDRDNDDNSERIMDVVHCIDQHCAPEIAHFVPYKVVVKLGGIPKLFGKVWDRVSGKNARKTPDYLYIDNPDTFVQHVRQAQKLVWLSRSVATKEILATIPNKIKKLKYSLDPSWLSSFIGAFQVRIDGIDTVVVANPDNLLQFQAVKKPSRGESARLTEKQQKKAISKVKELLKEGQQLMNIPQTLRFFRGASVRLTDDEDDYLITLAGSRREIEWRRMLKLPIKFEVLDTDAPEQLSFDKNLDYLEYPLSQTGAGVRPTGSKILARYLSTVPIFVLQRAMLYINFEAKIELNRISRDGSGVDLAVTPEDIGVNQILMTICYLLPTILERKGNVFHVNSGPGLWAIRDVISRKIRNSYPSSLDETLRSNRGWQPLSENDKILRDYQTEIVQDLLETRYKRKARIIWVPMGMGKTTIITTYLDDLINQGKMNKYFIYLYPKGSLTSISAEFEKLNVPIAQVTKKSPKIKPYRINFIEHDHFKFMDLEYIKSLISETFLVVDELHKALDPTLRTSVILEFARLAADTVAMTGTLVKDDELENLVRWLRLTVNFEVTKDNFWVAMAAIMARDVDTGVKIKRKDVETEFTAKEAKRYYASVPSQLGGTAQKIDIFRAMTISHQAIKRGVFNLVRVHLGRRIGVFAVTKDAKHQLELAQQLIESGVPNKAIYLVGTGSPDFRSGQVNLTPNDAPPDFSSSPTKDSTPQVVITTMRYAEGYNLSRYYVMITGVYPSNQATRSQMEGRINRMNQTEKKIYIYTVHAGIFTKILGYYEKTRNFSQALKGFSKQAHIDVDMTQALAF